MSLCGSEAFVDATFKLEKYGDYLLHRRLHHIRQLNSKITSKAQLQVRLTLLIFDILAQTKTALEADF